MDGDGKQSTSIQNESSRKDLNKHNRFTIKNYGPPADSIYQDVTVEVSSDNTLSTFDEYFLKFIALDSCFGPILAVGRSMMDANKIVKLETEQLIHTGTTIPAGQNMCASEVLWNLFQHLLSVKKERLHLNQPGY